MSRILSQDEIDALLASAAVGRAGNASAASGSDGVVPYNFRRPDRVSKEQLRALHLLHERFALNVSTSLSAFLRAVTEVRLISVEQFVYSEFLMSLPDPTAFYAVGMQPLDGLSALELNPAVAFTMIDRLLGGTGATPGPNRALTEIEQNVVDSVMKVLLENLSESWKPITDVHFRIHGRETRPQMLQVTGPNEVVILIVFDIRIGETRGMINVCIPASVIESVGDKFAQGWYPQRRQPTAQEEQWLHANLARVPLPVSALLQTTMSTREFLSLQRGDVIVLNQPATGPVQVHVSAVPRFEGQLVRHGDGLALAILRMSDDINEEMKETAA